ncbi:MAG TPA: CRISPR-associated endonuclease Cas2 [Chloroflexota bacterium]|jgi:CRISPR-associated protein Cas2|nr:CRISPR-associated endonuclease Cas2 [Chloroflexota bacterium]
MQCLVIYDISSDRIRRKIADLCLDYGLARIQYSAFMGNLSVTHQTELYRLLQRALGRTRGNIQIMPMDERSYSARRLLGDSGKKDVRPADARADIQPHGKEDP